jgi:hypothetical protein
MVVADGSVQLDCHLVFLLVDLMDADQEHQDIGCQQLRRALC